jgi:hypothetical protein
MKFDMADMDQHFDGPKSQLPSSSKSAVKKDVNKQAEVSMNQLEAANQ